MPLHNGQSWRKFKITDDHKSADRSEPPDLKNCSTTVSVDAKYVFQFKTFMLAFLDPWLVDAKFDNAVV